MAEEMFTWIDPAGVAYPLNDPGTYFVPGPLPAQGQYGVPLAMVDHQIPLLPGRREQYIQIDANDVRMPLLIHGDTTQILDAQIRTLSEAMRPTRGRGVLQHQSNDGTVRQLFCREVGRLRDVQMRSPGWAQVGLQFYAADPFWYDFDYTTVATVPAGVATFFQNPFFPIHLSASSSSNAFTIFNNGQDVAWPIWTITGPGTNFVLTNTSTGQALTAGIALTAGQAITIDTRPDKLTVTREDGSNQWATITPASLLWSLAVGSNAITIAITGGGVGTSVQLQYKQRYEGV